MEKKKGVAVFSVLIFLAIWELAYYLFPNPFLSSPFRILKVSVILWGNTEFLLHVRTSALEFALGSTIAIVSGLVIGLLVGWFALLARISTPFLASVYATPIYAIVPVFLLLLGIDLMAKVAVVALIAFFPVVIVVASNTKALREQEESSLGILAMSKTYGARRFFLLRHVIIPFLFPVLFSAVRLGLLRAIVGVFIAELFVSYKGLGFFIVQSGSLFRMEEMYSGIFVFTATGLTFNALLGVFERKICFWRGI